MSNTGISKATKTNKITIPITTSSSSSVKPRVEGVVSLATFAGRTITLDLAHDRVVVESPVSARTRAHGMLPLRLRLGTGADGSELLAKAAGLES